MLRSHSTAYPPTGVGARLTLLFRQHSKAVIATLAFFAFVFVMSLDSFQHPMTHSGGLRSLSKSGPSFGGAVHKGYFNVNDAVENDTFHFAAVTDLDKLSRIENSLSFRSVLLPGTITRGSDGRYSINFEGTRTLVSKHNEGGRGMELSELILYQNRLLSFDDRTGSVFEILNKDEGRDSHVVPRFVITEGEGDTDKGMKWEWASVKDGELYMGSMGKEYTDSDGNIKNTNNLWISVLNRNGEIRREDWSKRYTFIREKLGALPPGYVINEAIMWSSHLKKWVFLPRRVSSEMYDDVVDEKKGATKIVLVNERFTEGEVIDIKIQNPDPLHGFSTFAFVPGTKDHHVLAVRTVEEDCALDDESKCKQRSYFIVVDVLTGDVLMDEVQYTDNDLKFEGVEFVNIYTPEKQ